MHAGGQIPKMHNTRARIIGTRVRATHLPASLADALNLPPLYSLEIRYLICISYHLAAAGKVEVDHLSP